MASRITPFGSRERRAADRPVLRYLRSFGGLGASAGCARRPFDRLRANGDGWRALSKSSVPTHPFGLSLSKPLRACPPSPFGDRHSPALRCLGTFDKLRMLGPFDGLRANGEGGRALSTSPAPKHPFGLSLSKPLRTCPPSPFGVRQSPALRCLGTFDKLRMLGPFDRLRANGGCAPRPFDRLRANGGVRASMARAFRTTTSPAPRPGRPAGWSRTRFLCASRAGCEGRCRPACA